jgi:hypothetical protein
MTKRKRLEMGYEMMGLFQSNLKGMTISELAVLYEMTPRQVVILMQEAMEAEEKILARVKSLKKST